MRSCTKNQPEPSEDSPVRVSSCSSKSMSQKLEHIDENVPASWQLPLSSSGAPETPTKSMEFLARSWSVSAMELSKALSNTQPHPDISTLHRPSFCSSHSQEEANDPNSPISPRDSEELKELFFLHQALNPEFLSNQQLLRSGLYKSIMKGRTMGRWLKDQKERKKQEMRTHNAHVHAAVSVAGVAAAVAALVASNAVSTELESTKGKASTKSSAAMASAAALVASHCIEIAEDMGADHDQILAVVNSAVNAKSNGDIMTLTAGAATALRGAATLSARLQKGSAAFALGEKKSEDDKEFNVSAALDVVTSGGELLKRTRKGDLHWKQVSFSINSNWQVMAKLKSKHMARTFTKKKKCVVFGVYGDVPAFPGREQDEWCGGDQRAYFGVRTADRVIEFECRSDADKQMWIKGIEFLLNSHTS